MRATRRLKGESPYFQKMLTRVHLGARTLEIAAIQKMLFFLRKSHFFIFEVEISSACARQGARALEFSQSMDLQLSNAVSHVSIGSLVIFLASCEIPHKIEKKRAGLCPAVLKDFLHQNSNSRLWVAHETNYFKSNRAKP